MNRIVKEHYPVEKLPEDLREGLAPGTMVSVTLETEASAATPRSVEDLLQLTEVVRRTLPRRVSGKDAAQRIRDLRDEWDD
ncbi:hypothetical protein [Breoghania sp. JC706]|uniref:hypothetical protein n=1 Tax=Breoghania sp. JC706 TaxID=3117732 RepID=UPI00300AC8C6